MIKAVKSEKVTSNIVDHIKTQFVEGKLPAGSKLPPERKLALEFGISRSSVREAISILKTMGILEVRHRNGIFVCGPNTGRNNTYQTSNSSNPYGNRTNELIEFIELMLIASIPLIVVRITGDDIKNIKTTVERIKSCIANGMKGTWFELELFLLLIHISGNIFFYQTITNMKGLFVEVIQAVRDDIVANDIDQKAYIAIMEEFSAILATKEPGRIKPVMERYFQMLKQNVIRKTTITI